MIIDLTLPPTFWPLAFRLALVVLVCVLAIVAVTALRLDKIGHSSLLWRRCVVWVALASGFLLANGLGPLALSLPLAVVAAQAMREIGVALTRIGIVPDTAGMGAMAFFSVIATGVVGDRFGLWIAIGAVVMSGLFALRLRTGIVSVLASVFSVSAVALPFAILVSIRWGGQGFDVVAWTLLTVWLADIAAMFGGLAIGRRHLAPALSPGKTVEGSLIGLLGALAGAALVRFALPAPDAWVYVAASLLLAVAGLGGDLAASALKRKAGLKDFGTILPGHGGVMDRFDSLLIAVPMAALFSGLLFNG